MFLVWEVIIRRWDGEEKKKSTADDLDQMGFIESYENNCGAISFGADSWQAISVFKHDVGGNHLSFNNAGSLIYSEGGEYGPYYDLYRYNEATATWENAKNSTDHSDFTSFEIGRGYIYRTSIYTQMVLGGIENTGTISYSPTFTSSCPDPDLKGFNLIGNPYSHSIVKGEDLTSSSLTTGYYSLTPDGSWRVHLDSDPIGIGQAVLVKVTSATGLSFTDSEGNNGGYKKGVAGLHLQFTVSSNNKSDIAYAIFSSQSTTLNSEGLPKVSHLNAEAPSLSIPQGGTDYAIAMIDGSTQAFPLKFRAVGNGEYTVSVSGDMSEMGYLHLIDRATGRDIDLLSQPTYTFTNTCNQSSTQRFTVKLSPNADEEDNGIFAYQNGDRVVVEGTGTLHVYDVLGRQLYTHEISSQLSIPSSQFPGTGVYILRLGEKSQKLVIK